MIQHRIFSFAIFVATFVSIPLVADAGDAASRNIKTKRENDTVELKQQDKTTLVSIGSPVGISEAVITKTGVSWPADLTIRLRLGGLEHFSISNGETKLHASVSSHGDGQVRLWKDNAENRPLNKTSPFWMKIRRVAKKREKDGPSQSYFEMQLPSELFISQPKSIQLKWIDFYRG